MLKSFIVKYIIGVISLFFLTSCVSGYPDKTPPKNDDVSMVGSISQTSSTMQTGSISEISSNGNTGSEDSSDMEWPIDDGEDRMTKKTFGLQVSPTSSPISPEKFRGFHTGIDFETTENERDKEIEIRAICNGPLVYKNWVSGYGGVAIQKCTLESEEVTMLYGHLYIDTIDINLNAEIKAGKKIGILGKGYSTETDGERKHLHLSIHKGTTINLKGYVASEGELDSWIDPMEYLK